MMLQTKRPYSRRISSEMEKEKAAQAKSGFSTKDKK
jgi:hypothetical protein